MIKVLVSPPFAQSIAIREDPAHLSEILIPGLARRGIRITDKPAEADWEIAGYQAPEGPEWHRLPKERVIVLDGEVPQPEFINPVFRGGDGFAAVLSCVNQKIYADCFPFFIPPHNHLAPPRKRNKIIQLSTYRSLQVAWMEGVVNGEDPFRYRVLCTPRCSLGLAIKERRPQLIDIFGRGWPEGVCVENSRSGAFRARKAEILPSYGFDLCWENMEIPNYVSEKLWDPIAAGILPLYWGPPQIHDILPKESIIDCRSYSHGALFDVDRLIRDVEEMSEAEYCERVERLRDWHRSLPVDAQARSLGRAVDLLAREIVRLHQWAQFNAAMPGT